MYDDFNTGAWGAPNDNYDYSEDKEYLNVPKTNTASSYYNKDKSQFKKDSTYNMYEKVDT